MATERFDESPAGDRHGDGRRGIPPAPGEGRWHPVTLLLLLPVVLSLLTTLYNRDTPRLFGFPAFYWLQLAWVLVGVTSTTIVYQVTKRRGGE